MREDKFPIVGFCLERTSPKAKGIHGQPRCRYEKRGMQMESERLASKNRLGYNPNVNQIKFYS